METRVPSWVRGAFLVAAAVLLITGLALFVFAESVATLPANARAGNPWPWPIGPLALRFAASLALAAALVSYLAGLRPDLPTLAAFGTLTAILEGMLLVHALISLGNIDWSKPLAFVWVGALLLAFLCSLFLAVWARRRMAVASASPPLPPTPRAARYIAIFISALTGVVGALLFFIPGFGRERWPWDLANSTNVQLFGAIFLAVGLAALWTWLQPSWYGYDIFYPAAGLFATIALGASFMHWNLFANKPLASWVFVAVYIMGAIMGFYPYFRYALRPGSKPALQST